MRTDSKRRDLTRGGAVVLAEKKPRPRRTWSRGPGLDLDSAIDAMESQSSPQQSLSLMGLHSTAMNFDPPLPVVPVPKDPALHPSPKLFLPPLLAFRTSRAHPHARY